MSAQPESQPAPENFRVPWYQTVVGNASLMLAGALSLGALLDALGNANSLITPTISYVGASVLLLTWLILYLLLRHRGLGWRFSGKRFAVRALGPKINFAFLGMIVLLLLPRLSDSVAPTDFFIPRENPNRLVAKRSWFSKKTREFPQGIAGYLKTEFSGDTRCLLWTPAVPSTLGADRISLLEYLDSDLRSVWSKPYEFDPVTPYPKQNNTHNYRLHRVRAFDVDGIQYFFCIYDDHPFFSSSVVVLDETGKLKKQMWHPGHLDDVLHCGQLFVFWGYNNTFGEIFPQGGSGHHPAIFAVTFDNIKDLAPSYYGDNPQNRDIRWYYTYNKALEAGEWPPWDAVDVRNGKVYARVKDRDAFFVETDGKIASANRMDWSKEFSGRLEMIV
ncbi:MAG: hypothetical protein MN733_21550, partial [Nitrososphaera sp.]|nr:hypothetical protein [Nitrososphaera sp.]